MKRTFFAVDIPVNTVLSGVLLDIRNQLKGERIKWIPADQLHLTLKFLGDTPENSVQEIINAVSESLSNSTVIPLHLGSVGVFKSLKNPRIIWIGAEPCPPLQQIAAFLDESLLSFGFATEEKEFRPHLTIGRVKEINQREKLSRVVEQYRNESFGMVSLNAILFYESCLKPEGPVYLPLKRFPLR